MFRKVSSSDLGKCKQAFDATRCMLWQEHFMHVICGNASLRREKIELCVPTIELVVSAENPTKLKAAIENCSSRHRQ